MDRGTDKPSDTEALTVEDDADVLSRDPRIGAKVGQCTIKRVIGRGGMGTVYEALQERPRRTVALKMMRRGIASKSAMRRFEFESQILGRLKHPGIAAVYDAGTHDEGEGGVPYFLMEYIPNAVSIVKYANEKKLETRERLELFSKVCDAVQHGHMKGIVHRDLKPGNILVDSSGQPKIIDFGVARSTDSDLAVTTLQTDVGQLIGTLQYMSPEQVAADPNDIDTRSDVYSLGMVLYELLTGKPPYDVKTLAIHEAVQIIREEEPTKLSTIDGHLRGDVETIALKALDKERDRRYQSAGNLQQDIERYLAGEAISASPPSLWDQVLRLARRNRAAAVAAVTILIVLVGAVIGVSGFAADAHRERLKAETAYERASESQEIAEDMAVQADRVAAVATSALAEAEEARTDAEDFSQAMEASVDILLRLIGESGGFESELAWIFNKRTGTRLFATADENKLGTLVTQARDRLKPGSAREREVLAKILYAAASEPAPEVAWTDRLQWLSESVTLLRACKPGTWVSEPAAVGSLTMMARFRERLDPADREAVRALWETASLSAAHLDRDAITAVWAVEVPAQYGLRVMNKELDELWRESVGPMTDLYSDSISAGLPPTLEAIAEANWDALLAFTVLMLTEHGIVPDGFNLRDRILEEFETAGSEDAAVLYAELSDLLPRVLVGFANFSSDPGFWVDDQHSLFFHEMLRDLVALMDRHEMPATMESRLAPKYPDLARLLRETLGNARLMTSDSAMAVVRAAALGPESLARMEHRGEIDLEELTQVESEFRGTLVELFRQAYNASQVDDVLIRTFERGVVNAKSDIFWWGDADSVLLEAAQWHGAQLSSMEKARADEALANLEGKSLQELRDTWTLLVSVAKEAPEERLHYFKYVGVMVHFRIEDLTDRDTK